MAGILEDCVAWKYLDKEAMHTGGAQPGGREGASLGARNGAAGWCCWEVGAEGTASQCGSGPIAQEQNGASQHGPFSLLCLCLNWT